MKAKLLREELNLFPRRLAWWDLTGRQIWLLGSFGALLTLITICCAISPSPVVPLVLFAALGICGAALLRPRLALLLAFACSGLPQFVLPLPGHNMHLIEPISLLCILVVVIRRPPMRLGMPHMLAVLFVTLAVISFIHVPEFSTKLSGYGADKRLLELLIIFTAFFYGSLLINYAEDTSSLLVAILLVSAPLYLIGLAQAMGIHLPALLETAGAQNLRLTQGRLWGPFPWSVNFGMYLANLFAISLACWLHGTHRWHRCIGFIMLVATILEMVGTGTRSVTIAAGVVIIIAFLITRRLKLLCTTILLAGIAIASTFNKLLPLFMHDETSTANRLLIWNEAIRLIQANPWIGIGLQQFHYYYAQIIVSPASQLGPLGIHPHQQYLEWAMESGIGWLVIGILLLLSILFSCWHAYRVAAQEPRALLLAALLAVLTNIIIGFLLI